MPKHLLFVLLFITQFLHSQTIFEKYQNNKDVTQISISPQMFNLISKFKISASDSNSKELIQMIQSLTLFRVMTTKEKNIATDMETWMQNEFQKKTLEPLLSIKENNVEVEFGAIYADNQLTLNRLVMYVRGLQNYIDDTNNIRYAAEPKLDFILFEIKGKIDLNQIANLSNLLEIPGGEFLDSF